MQTLSLLRTTLLSGALALTFLTPEFDANDNTADQTINAGGQETELLMAQTAPPGERRRVRRRTRRRVRRRQERRETTMMPTQSGTGTWYWKLV